MVRRNSLTELVHSPSAPMARRGSLTGRPKNPKWMHLTFFERRTRLLDHPPPKERLHKALEVLRCGPSRTVTENGSAQPRKSLSTEAACVGLPRRKTIDEAKPKPVTVDLSQNILCQPTWLVEIPNEFTSEEWICLFAKRWCARTSI
eukprot:Trichotokara_eunicae@DN7810_c0_g1_i1.p1